MVKAGRFPRDGPNPPTRAVRAWGRRLATFTPIPYAVTGPRDETWPFEEVGSSTDYHIESDARRDPGSSPAARAPGLRRMHGRAELPAAQGLRVAELGGDRGPAGQHRIDHVPGLVEGLQRSGPGPPHRAGLPGEPHAPTGRRAGPAGPRPAGHRRRRDLSADAAGHRVRPVQPDERPSRHRRRLQRAAASRTGSRRSGPRPAGSSTSGDGSGAASNRPTPACSPRSRTTTTRWSR